jgi:hypothetical protein
MRESSRQWRMLLSPIVAAAAGVTGSCTVLPPLEGRVNNIPVYKVVERVKCELAQAMAVPLSNAFGASVDGEPPVLEYTFLQDWVARFDLTLIVSAQSGLSPGVSFIDPLNQIVDKARGTFPQSFALGVGGGVNGIANRTEEVAFTISLAELYDEFKIEPPPEKEEGETEREYELRITAIELHKRRHHNCALNQKMDLDSDLGLKEWVKDALIEPIEPWRTDPQDGPRLHVSYLMRGKHRSRGTSSTAATTDPEEIAGKKATAFCTKWQDAIGEVNECIVDGSYTARTTEAASADITGRTSTSPFGASEFEPVHMREEDLGVREKPKECKAADALNKKLRRKLKRGIKSDRACFVKYHTYEKFQFPDDPLDLINHTVQFFLAWSVNATPTWSLMRFKGPGGGGIPSSIANGASVTGTGVTATSTPGSGSFASASRIDTHTLRVCPKITFTNISCLITSLARLCQRLKN